MIACIVVTAFRDLDLAMQAMRAGAVAFIAKPFEVVRVLLTALNGALRNCRELADEALRLRFLGADARAFSDGARQRARS